MMLPVLQCLQAGLDHVIRGVKIRVAAPQVDDVLQPGGELQHPSADGDILLVESVGQPRHQPGLISFSHGLAPLFLGT